MGDIYTNPPQSRNEAILRATIDGTEYTDPPQSRIEDLLLELKEAIEEGGGGGGTTVVPNPEGEATGDLNKVQIGSTIFGVLGELGTAAKKDSTNAVTEDSSDLVESGAVYSALDSKQPKTLNTPIIIGGVSRTTVEAALGALEDNKEDTILAATPLVKEYDEVMRQDVLRLTMDDTPTASSNNPVKSGGVKSAITATVDLMKDTTGWIGGNIIINKQSSTTKNGLTVTRNDDDSFTISGTATADTYIGGSDAIYTNQLNAGRYAFSGCPKGGSGSTYFAFARRPTTSSAEFGNDTGEGVVFTLSEDNYLLYFICVKNGVTVNNLVFKPMILTEEQYTLNPTYRPYHESVEDYIWDINAKTGVHQWIDIDNITAKSGAVLTLNDTGFRCVVGTATSWCGAVYRRRCPVNTDFELKLDTAITSGITYISVKGSTDGTNYTSIKTSDVLTTSGSIDIAFNTGNYTYLQIEFFTTNASVTTCDVTITNLLLKLANDTSDAVTDFTMTNRELTEKVGNSGTYDLYMIANALTPANGAQPEFFIPWNNPELKTPTFSFTIRIRNNSAWETLAQSGNINIQKVCKNGFLVNASLTDALTSNSQYTFRIDGTITF